MDGSDLPNARKLVREVLMKAWRSPPADLKYSQLALFVILFVTHDIHYQIPKRLDNSNYEISCCTKNKCREVPPHAKDADCLPIDIPTNDPFYKNGHIGCMNLVRSELGRYSDGVETGEIMNHATAFVDLSLIYGNRESELKPIRLFTKGLLRMSEHGVMPVDKDGNYLPSTNRFMSTPIATLWPGLFARNHNHLAQRLTQLNPQWNDETIFQEARRINIAIFQANLIKAHTIEAVFHQKVDEPYSELSNVATYLEFSFAYRSGHYYMPSKLILEKENGTRTEILQSDTIGKFDSIVEPNFDDALRGAINNPVNIGQYTDEIINRIDKNKDGYGIDLISIDIQRARDQGIPSFLEVYRSCNLEPKVETFDDFNKIFNETNVQLLKNIYKSPEDVEFYVAGMLETFEHVGNPLAGPTFGCVIGRNYKNVMAGDIYFYSSPSSPYPFTEAQIYAVQNFTFSGLLCANSNMKNINKLYGFTPSSVNPKVECENVPQIDLSAWAV